jgi:hypothetical protein
VAGVGPPQLHDFRPNYVVHDTDTGCISGSVTLVIHGFVFRVADPHEEYRLFAGMYFELMRGEVFRFEASPGPSSTLVER